MTRTIAASTLRRAILRARPGTEVDIWQTGGGVATLAIGPVRDGRAWLLAGPGTFDWSHPWRSRFYAADLNIGPDDDGMTPSETVATADDLARYVASHCECHGCPSVNTYHAGVCAECAESCTLATGHVACTAED